MIEVVRGLAKRMLYPILSSRARRRSKSIRKVNHDGFELLVYPEVFHPFETGSTKVFYDYLKNLSVEGLDVLELGAGSGLLSLLMAKLGAKVMASDINPMAIRGVEENRGLNQVSIECVVSDLFKEMPERRFDLIIVNPPFYARDPKSLWEHAFYAGKNYDYFARLFRELPQHLQQDGEALMILSRDLDWAPLQALLSNHGIEYRTLYSGKRWMEWFDILSLTISDFTPIYGS